MDHALRIGSFNSDFHTKFEGVACTGHGAMGLRNMEQRALSAILQGKIIRTYVHSIVLTFDCSGFKGVTCGIQLLSNIVRACAILVLKGLELVQTKVILRGTTQ